MMQLRYFVTGSAVILIAWLAVTFVHQVPSQRYLKHEKFQSAARPAAEAAPITAAVEKESGALSFSASR